MLLPVSFLVLILGVCLVSFREGLFTSVVLPNMVLVPGTALYPKWKDFPLPVITKVYFFNVTNSEDFMNKGAKPILQEVGPYVFEEWHHKNKINANPENFTTTYQQYRLWNFLPNESNGSLADVIHTLNPPAASVNGTEAGVVTFMFRI